MEESRDSLEASVSKFVEQRRRGRDVSMEEYVERTPEQAESLRVLLPVVCQLEQVRERRYVASGSMLSQTVRKLQRLGDFRIIRELGRGGMGVVFEAEQESLGRRVAIKVLPKLALLDDRRIVRFRHEAQTAARLHHTHIVPILSVGQHADYHYYVMPLIQGVGLDAIIGQLRRLVGIDSQVAKPHFIKNRAVGSQTAAHLAEALLNGERRGSGPSRNAAFEGDVQSVAARWQQTSDVQLRQPRLHGSKSTPKPSLSYFRNVAEIGRQVARALDHAHSRKIFHRDIKPGNVLLDVQRSVWVTDFGLAKSLGQNELSRSEDAVGTLRYMAPERFQGIAGAGSDVYSLGLTLYELLTLQPAFGDTTAGEMVQQITNGSPLRPKKLNDAVPRDLETIVLKAISHNPDQRYLSASAMAEDLQLFLDDRPIKARRVTTLERLWRWCRRNVALASLTAVVALLLIAVTCISVISNVETTVAYRQAQSAIATAATERKRAEEISEVALLALDRISAELTPQQIDDSRKVIKDVQGDRSVSFVYSDHTAVLLKEMYNHYHRMSERMGESAVLQDRKAVVIRRLGYVRFVIGHFTRALHSYREAIGLYRSLIESAPDSPDAYVGASECLAEHGDVLWAVCRSREAYQSYAEALAVLGTAPADALSSPSMRYASASAHYRLRSRRFVEGLPEWMLNESNLSNLCGTSLGHCQSWGRSAAIDRAIEILRPLLADYPDDPRYRRLLALCLREQAATAAVPERDVRNDEAIELLLSLTREEPLIPDYRYELAKAYGNVGAFSSWRDQDDFLHAIQRLELAEITLDSITRENPNIHKYVFEMASLYYHQATAVGHAKKTLHWSTAEWDRYYTDGEARRKALRVPEAPDRISNLVRAAATVQSLTKRSRDNGAYWLWYGTVNHELAKAYANKDDWKRARSFLEETLAALYNVTSEESSAVIASGADALLIQARVDLTDAIQREANDLLNPSESATSPVVAK